MKRRGSATITPAMKVAVIARDHHHCVLRLEGCTVLATVADHRANRGAGGSPTLNAFPVLIAACTRCNGEKENATGEVLAGLKRRGLRVEKDSTNAKTLTRCVAIPVTYPDGSTWYLEMDGSTRRSGQGFAY